MLPPTPMKTRLTLLAGSLAATGSLTAHPGHDHGGLAGSEAFAHQLSSGLFFAAAALGGLMLGWVALRRGRR